jgi:FkbH-like protein
MTSDAAGKELADYVLGGAASSALVTEALRLIDRCGRQFSAELAETVASYLAADPDAQGEALVALADRPGAAARYVYARLLTYRGDLDGACAAFGRTLEALPSPSPPVLLQRARLAAQRRSFVAAAADLQAALAMLPPYAFYVKSEKLLARVLASGQWQPRRKAKLAVLGSSTTSLLAPVLRAAAFRSGLELEIYEGLYGNYQQEVLDPRSGLYAFAPDVVVLVVNHRDLALPPVGGQDRAEEFCDRLRGLWSTVRERQPCHVIQVGLDVPGGAAWGSLEDTLAEGRRRVIAAANLAISADLPGGVSFVDVGPIVAQAGRDFWSAIQWHTAKQYPAAAALPPLADAIVAHAAAALGLSRKVLAVDLDNTLWHGVVGEDLVAGIRVGPPTPEGEGHLALQHHLKELQARGVLLAVCSKNNPQDAEAPFRQLDAMHLRLDDFAAFVVNWQDKATNLRQIAAELSLGLDSFVFLDDNPLERALVRSRLPQVAVPECGNTPWEMLAALEQGRYFETIALTEEDRRRHASYRSNSARKDLQTNAATLDDFLSGLEMVADEGPVDAATLPRVTQLINKTNQFNLTTHRYTEEQIRAMADAHGWWTRWYKLTDRFGEHGLVGVILARRGADEWEVDTWLMSCRVLGREMERFMCQSLLTAAREAGATAICGRYLPTEKNALVRNLYTDLGFVPDATAGQYRFNLGEQAIPECGHIRAKHDEMAAQV